MRFVLLLLAAALTICAPAASLVDDLRITEFNYNPYGGSAAELAAGGPASDTNYEFVEFTNIGSETLDLGGVKFLCQDLPITWVAYTFPAGTSLAAGGRIVLARDPAAFAVRYGTGATVVGPVVGSTASSSDGLLSNGGELLRLLTSDDISIMTFTYDDDWYKSTDGTDGVGKTLKLRTNFRATGTNWSQAAAWDESVNVHGSPGTNDPGFSGAPTFSRAAGTFTDDFSLTLTAIDPSSVIRYTTNGSLPNASSPIYTGPIAISGSVRIRAQVTGPELPPGPVVSAHYIKLGSAAGFASHLPVVVIENYGQGAPPNPDSEDRQDATLAILPPVGASSDLASRTGQIPRSAIRYRGSSSFSWPKKSYSIEFRDEFDEDADLAVLGMPANEDWALVGPYDYDAACLRNAVVYDLAAGLLNSLGKTSWAPRTRFVEVFSNLNGGAISSGDYKGVYIFVESVKRKKGRLDLKKLEETDTDPTVITGGYVLKVDRADPGEVVITVGNNTVARQQLVMSYPKEPNAAQQAYITGYIDEFARAIAASNFRNPTTGRHYREIIDVESFIDLHLVNVLFKNVDGLRLSTYYHKDRSKLLKAGAVWDFDRSADSKDPRDNDPWTMNGTGDATQFQNYVWWNRLFADPDFVDQYNARRERLLRGQLAPAALASVVRAKAAELQAVVAPETDSPAQRDAARWSSNSHRSFSVGGVTYTGHRGETERLVWWLGQRVAFLDSLTPDAPIFSTATAAVERGSQISLSSPNGGTIYYTLDGTDPRLPGGALSPAAIAYTTAITVLQPQTAVARVRMADGRWSPRASAAWTLDFGVPLRVTEVMFAPTDDPALLAGWQYLELKNVSSTQTLDLDGVQLADGVDFTFGPYLLAPGATVLVVGDLAAFEARYGAGLPVAGVFSGELAVGGERLTVRDAGGAIIQSFVYDGAWHAGAHYTGRSIIITDPRNVRSSWDLGNAWRVSDSAQGTPGGNETRPPESVADAYVVNEDGVLQVLGSGVLANDSDPDGDDLSANLISGPAQGVLVLNTNGKVTYTPPANFYGLVTFTYRASDGVAVGPVTEVQILVNAIDDAPLVSAIGSDADPVLTTQAALAVTASELDGSALSYAWAARGPAPVLFTGAAGGDSNAAQVTATFAAAGDYTISVSVGDGVLSTVRSRTLTVGRAPQSLSVPTQFVAIGTTRQAAAIAIDQFGASYTASATWELSAGAFTVSSSGLIDGAEAVGNGSVLATVAGLTATGTVQIIVRGNGVSVARIDGIGAEGTASPDTIRYRISRSAAASTPLPVHLSWGGTATRGSDYASAGAPVTALIPAGASLVELTAMPLDDGLVEGRETVTVTILADANYTTGVTVSTSELFDDEKPRVDLTLTDGVGAETAHGLSLRVGRFPVVARSVSVGLTYGGYAVRGSDYQLAGPQVTIPAGSAFIDLPVTVIDDALVEGTETISVGLAAQAGYQAGASNVIGRIADDERPEISLGVVDGIATEGAVGDTARFSISRFPASSASVAVALTYAGRGLSTVAALPSSVVIPANQGSAFVTVTALDDDLAGASRPVVATVAATAGYLPYGVISAAISVEDNDWREDDASHGTLAGLEYSHYLVPSSISVLPDLAALTPSATGVTTAPLLSPLMRDDYFAFQWTGWIRIPQDGRWILSTNSDDGSQWRVGEVLVVDNDGRHGGIERSGAMWLRAGWHPVRIGYFEFNGSQYLGLSWQRQGGAAKAAVPSSAWFRGAALPTAISLRRAAQP